MSRQQGGGGFNPGAFEFRPGGQQPFIPRGQQQQGQPQQPYGQYQQYGYPQQGQGYPGYPQQQHQQYGYQQQYPYQPQQQQQQQPVQQAFVPQQRTYTPPTQRTFEPRQVQGFQPPSVSSGPAPSISIGGSGSGAVAPKAAPSLSIGGGARKAAPSFSIGGAKPAAKAAPSFSIGKKEETKEKPKEKEVKAEPKPVDQVKEVKEVKEEKKVIEEVKPEAPAKEEMDIDEEFSSKPAAAATTDSAPAAAETAPTVPAPVDPSVKVIAKQSGTSTPTNFSKVSAKTDAEAIYKEQAAAGEEALRDLYGEETAHIKSHLNIIFTGHVDAGKSTMGGQLLYLTGAVDKRTMEKYEQEAKAAGRETWYLSWALDSGKEERAKGKTVEVGRAYFETEKRRYTILDAPGHKTYVPSMISGAAQADIAMLVLSARKGEFETGFERDGQTREHAVLVKNNGISKLVLLINKMDDSTVQWDQGRFDEIKARITPFLKSLGFNPKTDLTFIPVSAQMGQNMKDRVSKSIAPWYDGPSLLEFLDNMQIMDRNINAAFMLPVSEKYNELGTMVMGKIESGRVKKADTLLMMPNKATVEIAGIFTEDNEEMDQAFCGDNIRLRLRGISDEDVSPGFVLTSPTRPVKAVTAFKADLSIIETKNIICSGYSCVLHVHTLAEEVTLTSLLHYYDKKTKRKSKRPPQFAKVGMIVSALIETSAPICIERFEDYKMLGRFTLRDEGKTIAIGKVTKLIEREGDLPDVAKLAV